MEDPIAIREALPGDAGALSLLARQTYTAALDHPLLKDAAEVYLDVWEHNPGAQRFYRRYGFEVITTRRFEVASGAPTSLDLVMVRRQLLDA